MVQGFLSSQFGPAPDLHAPAAHTSLLVQLLPSSQGPASLMNVAEHLPVLASHAVFLQVPSWAVLQVTAVWLSGTHLYGALLWSQTNLPRQRLGLAVASQSAWLLQPQVLLPPTHLLLAHLSPVVHVFWSSQLPPQNPPSFCLSSPYARQRPVVLPLAWQSLSIEQGSQRRGNLGRQIDTRSEPAPMVLQAWPTGQPPVQVWAQTALPSWSRQKPEPHWPFSVHAQPGEPVQAPPLSLTVTVSAGPATSAATSAATAVSSTASAPGPASIAKVSSPLTMSGGAPLTGGQWRLLRAAR